MGYRTKGVDVSGVSFPPLYHFTEEPDFESVVYFTIRVEGGGESGGGSGIRG